MGIGDRRPVVPEPDPEGNMAKRQAAVETLAAADAKYTLLEAQMILTTRECNRVGHDFTVHTHLFSDTGAPIRVVCSRCGKHWQAVPRDDD